MLEKKNLSGNQLIAGRTLLGVARKGAQNFQKANSFAEEKWDVKKGEPKESSNTIEDVVNHARIQMHKFLQGRKLDIDEAEIESEQTNFLIRLPMVMQMIMRRMAVEMKLNQNLCPNPK